MVSCQQHLFSSTSRLGSFEFEARRALTGKVSRFSQHPNGTFTISPGYYMYKQCVPRARPQLCHRCRCVGQPYDAVVCLQIQHGRPGRDRGRQDCVRQRRREDTRFQRRPVTPHLRHRQTQPATPWWARPLALFSLGCVFTLMALCSRRLRVDQWRRLSRRAACAAVRHPRTNLERDAHFRCGRRERAPGYHVQC